jgi:hypothetical protein
MSISKRDLAEIAAITEAIAGLKSRAGRAGLDVTAEMELRQRISNLESKLKVVRERAGLPPGLTPLEAEADALEARIDQLAHRITPDPEDK